MTEEGIFLGGGDMAGNFKDWTIPNIVGEIRNDDGAAYYTGVFKYIGGYNYDASSSGGNGGRGEFNLNNLSTYVNHTNIFDKFYPNHYNVDWYIKYK